MNEKQVRKSLKGKKNVVKSLEPAMDCSKNEEKKLQDQNEDLHQR